MRFIKCKNCGYTWDYQGRNANRTTCPQCFKTVYFPSAEVDPETYRKYALIQAKNWYDIECARVNKIANQALSAPAIQ